MFDHLSTQELLCRLEELGDRAPMELIQAMLSKGPEVVLPLTKILEDEQYWEASGDKAWIPVHAVKLLGTLADPQALPQLIRTLARAEEEKDDWMMEDLPAVFGRIGQPAVEPLMEFIRKHHRDSLWWWSRSTAAKGLAAIAMRLPQERESILSFLHSLFSEGEDPEFLGSVACDLLDMADPSSFPVLEKAFKQSLIDESIVGREALQHRPEGPSEAALDTYNRDLLDFYSPQQIAKRQARWEKERKEEERRKALERQEREQVIAQELKRLEVAMRWEKPSISLRKVGRNEPCLCGSGKKFKKCCLPFVEILPPQQVLGEGYYASQEDLQRAAPYDPVLVLENLTALAFAAEEDGDVVRALDIFRKLEPLAERSGMLGPLLQHWGEVYCDHPELGEEGLTLWHRLRSFYQDQDQKEWAHACMDVADYLDRLGRWEEGRKAYENLLREMPGFPLAHIRFARFMERGGHTNEAVHHYQQVLQSEAQTGKDAFARIAAEELRTLASHHGLELDTWTQEAIKQWCGEVEEVPERP